MPWLEGWSYRKSHTITGTTAGEQTDYQVGIKAYYGSGADGTESLYGITFGKVYCEEHCLTDFGDIRFTATDGTTLLDFWIETKTDSDFAIIWVEVDYIPESPGADTIYIYYGKAGVTTTSSGDDTFEFFDDFEDESIDDSPDVTKWTPLELSGYVLIKANPSGGGQVLDIYGIDDGSNTNCTSINYSDIGEIAVGLKYRIDTEGDNWEYALGGPHIYQDDDPVYLWSQAWRRLDTPSRLRYYTGAEWLNYTPVLEYAINVWYRAEYRLLLGSMKANVNDTDYTGGYRQAYGSGIRVRLLNRGASEIAGHSYMDDVYVRKLRNPEPTHTLWGEVKTAPVDQYRLILG